ncbi:hypothetical protein ACX0G9_20315 [Flavitalea flava]
MIDGIQLTYYAPCNTHLTGLSCWEVTVNEQTGEKVDDIRRTSFRGLNLELKPAATGHRLTINGSLHKYHNGGSHNTNDFPFAGLQNVVSGLSFALGLQPGEMEIHGIEIGINVPLPFPPLRVLNNAVCFKNKAFRPIHKRNKRKGLVCCLWDYEVKLYDKAEQSGMDCGDILRVEVKVNKMRYLQGYGLFTLNDLTDQSKVYPLAQVLTGLLDGIIWTDKTADLNRMSNREQKQWLYLGNPISWEGMNKYQLRDNRKKLTGLFTRYAGNPVAEIVSPLLVDTWNRQFIYGFEAHNPPPFHRQVNNSEADKIPTFSPLECIREKVIDRPANSIQRLTGFCIEEKGINSERIFCAKNAQTAHSCISCGRDISIQQNHSRFCSELLYGQRAKQCRNKDSNRRRDLKRMITQAMRRNCLVTVYRGISHATCTLHPREITICREWLDSVQRIEILPGNRKESTYLKINHYSKKQNHEKLQSSHPPRN